MDAFSYPEYLSSVQVLDQAHSRVRWVVGRRARVVEEGEVENWWRRGWLEVGGFYTRELLSDEFRTVNEFVTGQLPKKARTVIM